MRQVAGAGLNEPYDDAVLQQKAGSRAERAERRGGLLLRFSVPKRNEHEEAAKYDFR
jgi:hypothetical protein